jgi:hypothetical protein
MSVNISELKKLTSSGYDLQKLRIMMGNRIAANFLAKLGIKPGESKESIDKQKNSTLKIVERDYKNITEGAVAQAKKNDFKGSGVISNYVEFILVKQYIDILNSEKEYFKSLEPIVKEFPLWNEFLVHVKGVGPMMAGVILSVIDIHIATHSSKIWKYAGIDVTEFGTGRSRKADSLVDRTYVNKDGVEEIRKSITFNPFLKTKLLGVLGPSFLRTGKDNKYSQIYYGYKNRLENHPNWAEESKLHIHNASIRYMIKMFIIDLYTAWRTLEGLPVSQPYHVTKLGLVHHENTNQVHVTPTNIMKVKKSKFIPQPQVI